MNPHAPERSEAEHVRDELAADVEMLADPCVGMKDAELLAAFEDELRQFCPGILQLNMGWQIAWALLGTIQLACRHPEFAGHTKKVVQDFGHYLETQLKLGSASAEVARRGWQTQFDVSPNE